MNIYITLDYELRLELDSGTVKNCLIRPSEALMNICDKTKSKMTFFVDGAYIYRLNQLKNISAALSRDYDEVLSNIHNLSIHGHSIQYHFHPQWLFSNYKEDYGWIMDFDHYKLSDVPDDILKESFSDGIKILKSITGKDICAYRAGGYSLCSPDIYIPLFDENGIKIDSSVLPGTYVKSKLQTYDYRITPKKSKYFFYENVCEESLDTKKSYIEMPISTGLPISSIRYLLEKKRLLEELSPDVYFADGGGGGNMPKLDRLKELCSKLFNKEYPRASIDSFRALNLWSIYKQNKDIGNSDMVVIGHPKAASINSLRIVEKWISDMVNEGNEFKTFEDIL